MAQQMTTLTITVPQEWATAIQNRLTTEPHLVRRMGGADTVEAYIVAMVARDATSGQLSNYVASAKAINDQVLAANVAREELVNSVLAAQGASQ